MVKTQLNRSKPPSSPTIVGSVVETIVLSMAAMKVAMRQASRTSVRPGGADWPVAGVAVSDMDGFRIVISSGASVAAKRVRRQP